MANDRPRLKFATLLKTCEACPSQWEGRLDDKRPVYIRYRYGSLSVQIGEPGESVTAAVQAQAVLRESIGDEYDGFMSTPEMLRRVNGEILDDA